PGTARAARRTRRRRAGGGAACAHQLRRHVTQVTVFVCTGPRNCRRMTYVIVEPCIGTKNASCVDVCPVSCIYEAEDMYYINPDECIECGACEPECPVNAIFHDSAVPDEWKSYTQKNRELSGL